ncbi:lipopolysaccharide assembly protein LapB [Dysgonomonas sp. 25]|uniref:tetratricopeptide repeat protein n=1 Tax=Dysgonomonas sp. 25 TaxID=2302933 RepID=UPI0013D2B02B|nr:tetratricopeptide repeat protein [Dysgonomonas sp. 25]NDV67447.1 tetratricopeptide repeat protein [Dysgonomonas sp. 25]
MNIKDIISKKKDILQYLSKRQLRNAFKSLNTVAANSQDWRVLETLSELETNYKFMLHYFFEKTEDAEREKVYNNLLRSLYELTDDITDELLKIESSNIFFERLRINEVNAPLSVNDCRAQLKDITANLSLLELIENEEEKKRKAKDTAIRRERIGSEMFNAIFVSPRAKEEDLASYKAFLESIDIHTREKCLLVSAITLNLLHRFDFRKIQLLMYAAAEEEMQVRARATVALIIIMQMYDVRWQYYPELQNQLDTLSENPDFRKSVRTVIIQLIRSRETERISKKITEEILPEMMRFNNLAGRKLNMEELLSDSDFSGKNPEWKKELEESGLADKLQEYSNLQMEGADVFHSTFSSLKNFPFFSEMGNWFMPFDTSYSEISDIFNTGDSSLLLKAAIIDSNHMCNSDKYSFCLSLLQIPQAQREIMLHRMGAESEEMKQMQREALEMNKKATEETVSNQYIQDLYRFFKLNPYRGNFFDIFKLRLNFYDKKTIAPLISDAESIRQIALYCFDKDNFKEALDIFEILIKRGEDNGDVWQKIGYCKQMLDDLDGALEAYLQADLITPSNSWILRRIAHIYRSKKEYTRAIEYYLKALAITPENMSLEMAIGHCYLELKDYEKALNSYFKVEFSESKESPKALRPIAWTAFLSGKFELAQKYYAQISGKNPTVHDFLNAGHVELCQGNLSKAIEYYKRSAQMSENYDSFVELFEADKEILVVLGQDKLIFAYLLDQIQYLTNM